MLFEIPLKVDHGQISSHLSSDTRTFTDLDALLQCLVDQGCLSSTRAYNIVNEASTMGGYVLAALTTLFMGTEASETFIASLPCDLSSSTNPLPEDNSSFWVASNFVAKFINSKLPEFQGWSGVYSISFDLIGGNYSDVNWKLPFGAAASSDQESDFYLFQHDRPMSFTIVQPAHPTQLISGQSRGMLQGKTTNYHIVADILLRCQQPPEYIFKFSDDDYQTDGVEISIADILRLLNCTDIDFSENLGQIILPGIESLLDDLKDSTGLSNGQFVLQKVLSEVLLKDISGEVISHAANWQPFGPTKFSFTVEKLRTCLRQVNSVKERQFAIEVDGCMDFNDSDNIKIPIQLSASFTPQESMLFEVILLPRDDDFLSVSQLFEVVGLGSVLDLGTSFPGISDLSNVLPITHISIGWLGLDSLLPESLKLVISLGDWDIIENILHIKKSAVEIQAANLSSNEHISLSLHGWGNVKIGNTEFELYFNPADGSVDADMIDFQIATEGRSIRLDAIIKHFFGGDFSLLPERFNQLLEETGINRLAIQATRTDSSWSISQFGLSVKVETTLDIFVNMMLEDPTLLVDIQHPFDSKQRTISTSIDATLYVGNVPSSVSIVITSEAETEVALVFSPTGYPLTVRNMANQFIPDSGTVTLPHTVSFLADTGLQKASISMQLSNGKFKLSQLLISVVSSRSLILWDEIRLEQVSLLFSYTKGTETMAEFHSMLTFANNTKHLDFSLVYESASESATSEGGSSLTATAKYSGPVSTLDILSRVSGIDLRTCFKDLSLSALTDVLDIRMSNLTATLRHDTTTNSFSFDADTDWLCFSHLRFACSKSKTWSYSLGFSIRPDVDVLQYIPILGPILDSDITLTNIAVVMFNHTLDVAALPIALSIPANSIITQNSFSVAFAGTLTLASSPLQTLAKALHIDTLDVLGVVGDKSIFLSVSVKPIYLCDRKVSLVGSVVLNYSQEVVPPKFEVGIQGTAVLDFGEHVSKNPITTSLLLFVDFSTAALGFEFKLDRWEGVFGYTGLNFKNVMFGAKFPPQQEFIPSELTISGTVDLSVNKARFDGSVDIYFLEQNILKSYAKGSINGLSLNNIIEAFSEADPVPQHLDLGFGPLEFKIVPTTLVDSKGEVMEEQFYFKGSFKIPHLHFSAEGMVDISKSHVLVDGRLSPVIVLDKSLFSILASSHENPPGPGASIHVRVYPDSPFGAKISGRMTFLSVTNDIYLKASPAGLEFNIDREWVMSGSLNGIINEEQLALSATHTFPLNLHIPKLLVGSVPFGNVFIGSFSASMDTIFKWSSVSWVLNMTGEIVIHGLTISKSFTYNRDFKDLASLAQHIASTIMESFGSDLVKVFNNLIDDIERVLAILKDFDLELFDMINFIHESCSVGADRVSDIIGAALRLKFDSFLIVQIIVEIFGMLALDVWKIIQDAQRAKRHTTLAEVQDMLQLTLETNANNLLRDPTFIKSSSQLPSVVREYAITAFKKEFGYDYKDTSTTPLDAISFVNLTATDGIFSCTDGKQKNIDVFMNEMLKAQEVPSWMRDQAQIDLLEWGKNIAGITTRNDWQNIGFVHTYDPRDESRQNSIRTNTILVFVNGSLTVNDVTANKTVVYYVGVYYQVITPLVATRQKLKKDAYNQANPFMNDKKVIGDDTSLTTALESYGKTLFKKHFSYSWGGDSPDDGPYLKASANALGYFEGGYTDGLHTFVKNKLLKGNLLPGWTSDTVISDIVSTFTNLITNVPYNGSWSSLNVVKMYDDSNGVHNSLNVNAVVVYYVDSKTTDNGMPVKMAYIYWIGMIFEKPPPATAVYNNMIEMLYHNLHGATSDISTGNLMPNKTSLTALLSHSASFKFKRKFGYDFNTSSITPSDSNGDEVYAVECFGEFKDVTKSAVSTWTADNIFKSSTSIKDNTFSFTNVPDLGFKPQLDNQIVRWLTENTMRTSGNTWANAEVEHMRSHPSDSSKVIKTAAVVIYANGKVTTVNTTTAKSNFFYYMGVYYIANDSNSASDV